MVLLALAEDHGDRSRFALRKYKPGDEVKVAYARGGETKTVSVVLSKRE